MHGTNGVRVAFQSNGTTDLQELFNIEIWWYIR